MKKSLLLFFLLVSAVLIRAQDSLWQPIAVYDLTVLLPGKISRMDTTLSNGIASASMVVYSSQPENSLFGVTVLNQQNMDVYNAESLKTALNKAAKGYCKSAGE